ncbi:hypothetical protein HDU96_003135, partial [Phlyctochytrium bullatum]
QTTAKPSRSVFEYPTAPLLVPLSSAPTVTTLPLASDDLPLAMEDVTDILDDEDAPGPSSPPPSLDKAPVPLRRSMRNKGLPAPSSPSAPPLLEDRAPRKRPRPVSQSSPLAAVPELASFAPRPSEASNKELLELAKQYVQELPTVLSFAKYHIAKHMARAEASRPDSGRYSFKIGDLAWLSAPIGNDKSPKKFKFRWVGPVRVIGHSADSNRYCLVEVLPDGNLLPRLANAARLRPYVARVPIDNPDAVSSNAGDDFASEVAAWRELRVYQRRPALKVARDINVELIRRADPDSMDEDPSDPEYIIERLDRHHLNVDEKMYYYHVKWLGYGTAHNLWHAEHSVPVHVVQDYWERLQFTDSSAYRTRSAFLKKNSSYLSRCAARRKQQDKADAQRRYTPAVDDPVDVPVEVPKALVPLPLDS